MSVFPFIDVPATSAAIRSLQQYRTPKPPPLTGYAPGMMAERPRVRSAPKLPREDPGKRGRLWLDAGGTIQVSRGVTVAWDELEAESLQRLDWAHHAGDAWAYAAMALRHNSMQDVNAKPADAQQERAARTAHSQDVEPGVPHLPPEYAWMAEARKLPVPWWAYFLPPVVAIMAVSTYDLWSR